MQKLREDKVEEGSTDSFEEEEGEVRKNSVVVDEEEEEEREGIDHNYLEGEEVQRRKKQV